MPLGSKTNIFKLARGKKQYLFFLHYYASLPYISSWGESEQPLNCSQKPHFSDMWHFWRTPGRTGAGRRSGSFGMPSGFPPPPHSQSPAENGALKRWEVRPVLDPNCAIAGQSSATERPPCGKPDSLLFDRKWRLGRPECLEMISELRETWSYKQKKKTPSCDTVVLGATAVGQRQCCCVSGGNSTVLPHAWEGHPSTSKV